MLLIRAVFSAVFLVGVSVSAFAGKEAGASLAVAEAAYATEEAAAVSSPPLVIPSDLEAMLKAVRTRAPGAPTSAAAVGAAAAAAVHDPIASRLQAIAAKDDAGLSMPAVLPFPNLPAALARSPPRQRPAATRQPAAKLRSPARVGPMPDHIRTLLRKSADERRRVARQRQSHRDAEMSEAEEEELRNGKNMDGTIRTFVAGTRASLERLKDAVYEAA